MPYIFIFLNEETFDMYLQRTSDRLELLFLIITSDALAQWVEIKVFNLVEIISHLIHAFKRYTVPIYKIFSVKNARAWVSMISYLRKQIKN